MVKITPGKLFHKVLAGCGSGKAALVLVVLVILFILAGAMLPQQGIHQARLIREWQQAHPVLTGIFEPVGLFGVFHSRPFLLVILLLTLNTLACTFSRLINEGGFAAFKGPNGLRASGFLLLHLGLIAIMAGAFITLALRMDGLIYLTEGQFFKESHQNYIQLMEAPFRKEKHLGFMLKLERLEVTAQKQGRREYTTGIESYVSVFEGGQKTGSAVISVNQPYTYRGIDFTQDNTGFSPRLELSEARKPLFRTYLALTTGGSGSNRLYRDILPVPVLAQRRQNIVVTLLPNYRRLKGKPVKSSDQPDKPLILVELRDSRDKIVSQCEIPLGGSGQLGDYRLAFTGLRRWSSFRVVDDPGYNIVWISLLMSIVGIILRYIPDLRGWFNEEAEEGSQ